LSALSFLGLPKNTSKEDLRLYRDEGLAIFKKVKKVKK